MNKQKNNWLFDTKIIWSYKYYNYILYYKTLLYVTGEFVIFVVNEWHLVDQNNNFPRLSHLLPLLQMFLSDIHSNSGFPASCREADDDVLFLQSWSRHLHLIVTQYNIPLTFLWGRKRDDPVIRQLCLPAASVQRRSCVSGWFS